MKDFYRQYLDADIYREGTECEKWDGRQDVFGRGDVVPMWVADMDFPTVPEVCTALVKRAQHPIYGYTRDNTGKRAEVDWLRRRHHLEIQEDWILYSPGVVDSMAFCIRALTHPGDAILIQTPVYGPFYTAVEQQGRVLRKRPLLLTESGWKMDFQDMERAFQEGVRFMMLCNPHNPVGRVWREEELRHALRLANQYGVIVVCDEIHADFAFEHKTCRILSLPEADQAIMLTSATKSFNLAGLRNSSVIVRNDALRKSIRQEIRLSHADASNIFGALAQRTAYEHGDEWMDAVLEYIRENRDYAVDYIRKNVPKISTYPQEGTYLMWLDCSAMEVTDDVLMRRMIDIGGVGLSGGRFFGEEGSRHLRFNLATQRKNLLRALEGIRMAAE